MDPENQKFNPFAKFFHWVMALLIIFQIPLALYMIKLPLSPDKFGKYALHKSIGICLLALIALRLAWKLIKKHPPLPSDMPRKEQLLAHATHGVLYLIIFGLPITGWISSNAANFPVSVFGVIDLPSLVQPNKELHYLMEGIHKYIGYVLIALISIHVFAAFYHHFARKDNVLLSMLPWAKLRKKNL